MFQSVLQQELCWASAERLLQKETGRRQAHGQYFPMQGVKWSDGKVFSVMNELGGGGSFLASVPSVGENHAWIHWMRTRADTGGVQCPVPIRSLQERNRKSGDYKGENLKERTVTENPPTLNTIPGHGKLAKQGRLHADSTSI